jgi:hypothetical protein
LCLTRGCAGAAGLPREQKQQQAKEADGWIYLLRIFYASVWGYVNEDEYFLSVIDTTKLAWQVE